MRRKRNLTLVTLGLMLSSCGPSAEDRGPDLTPAKEPLPIVVSGPATFETNLKCPKGTYLTYENFGAGFLSTYCLSCHSAQMTEGKRGGAPLAANFDTAYDASRYRALMLTKTQGSNPSMPPGQILKPKEKAAFAEWLNCGAPRKNSQ